MHKVPDALQRRLLRVLPQDPAHLLPRAALHPPVPVQPEVPDHRLPGQLQGQRAVLHCPQIAPTAPQRFRNHPVRLESDAHGRHEHALREPRGCSQSVVRHCLRSQFLVRRQERVVQWRNEHGAG